jgi:uncharacterized protein involved in exopolysaccharide biosynthesis
LQAIWHRLWLVGVIAILFVVGAFVYLSRVTPIYVSSARLTFNTNELIALHTECDLVQSTRVLLQAGAERSAAPDPITRLKEDLTAQINPSTNSIDISLRCTDPQKCASLLNQILDAYLHARTPTAQPDYARLSNAQQALEDFRRKHPDFTPPDPAKIKQLQSDLAAAQSAAIDAKAQLDATQTLASDPTKLAALIEANRSRGIFAALDPQKNQIDSELTAIEPQLKKQKETMGVQNPTLVATQAKFDELKDRQKKLDAKYADVFRATEEQQLLAAQVKQKELEREIAKLQTAAADSSANAAAFARLQAEVKSAEAAILPSRLDLTAGDVRITLPPTVPTKPIWPPREKILFVALALGLGLGFLLAALRP